MRWLSGFLIGSMLLVGQPDTALGQWSGGNGRLAVGDIRGVVTMNSDGSDEQILGLFGGWPSWSPDGSEIAYVSGGGIRVAASDGSADRLVALVPGLDYATPSWSPGGDRLVVSASHSVRIACLSAGPCGDGLVVGSEPIDCNWAYWPCQYYGISSDRPAWAPAGDQIAYFRQRMFPAYLAIWLVNADGTGAHELFSVPTDVPIGGDVIDWHPSGEFLSFNAGGAEYSVNLDGTVRNQTPGYLGRWAPDGTTSADVVTDDAWHRVRVRNLAGALWLSPRLRSLSDFSWQRTSVSPPVEVPESPFAPVLPLSFVVVAWAVLCLARRQQTARSRSLSP